MVIYSSYHGQTLIDNFDESFIDSERELPSEVMDIEDSWSGNVYDWFSSDSDYQRPSLF